MGKQVNFLLGISLAMVIILLSVTSAYALYIIEFTLVDTIGGFNLPTDMVVDSTGRIIIADFGNNRIQIYDANGSLENSITDADGPGTRSNFSSLYNVAVDSNDRIIASDGGNSRVQVFNSDGSFVFSISTANNVRGVVTDSNDRIIVAEPFSKRIQIYNSTGNLVDTISDGGNTIKGVWDVAVDSNDRIIAVEWNKNIFHIFNSDGSLVNTVSTVGGINQRGVATDSFDRIFITDQNTNQIHIYNSDGDFITSLSHENKDFSGITTDSNDRIIAADIWNNQILFFELNIHLEGQGTSDSCSSDCTAPSLESLELNNISNGLTAKNQTFNIGDKQVLKFVYFENEGIDDIKDVEIGFGLPTKKSPMYKSEIRLQINTFNGNITSLEIKGNDKLFLNSTTVNVDKVQCGFFDCLEYTLEFIWAEIPFDNYFLIIASDDHRNKSYNSNQEAFTVIGETLNEEPTLDIYNRYSSTKHDGYSFNITRTDKITDMWIDEYGKEWGGLGNDRFELVSNNDKWLTNLK